MKHILYTICFFTIFNQIVAQNNIGFENKTFKYWRLYRDASTTTTLPLNDGMKNCTDSLLFKGVTYFTTATAAPYHSITSGATSDKYGKYPVVCNLLGAGNYSAKMGDDAHRSTAQGIRYNIRIPNDTFTHRVVYYYAVNLEDPGSHSCMEMPLFTAKILDSATNKVIPNTAVSMDICTVKHDTTLYGQWKTSSTLSPNGQSVFYTSWTPLTMVIDKQYNGKTITLQFMSAGCSLPTPGSHFGYAYIDVDSLLDRYSQPNLDTIYYNPVATNGNFTLNEPPGYKTYIIKDSATNKELVVANSNLISINPILPDGEVVKVILTPYKGYGVVDSFIQHIKYQGAKVYSINGKIINALGTQISKVEVPINGDISLHALTDNFGSFSIIEDSNFAVIRPFKNNDINKTNGITTLDMALIQSHILGKNKLNSPYKIIAADVNGDSKVTTLDIVYMKRLILGLDTTFTNTTNGQKRLWAFVDSSYSFPDTTNPFPFKDSISYVGLSANKTNQTFIGVKLGDVNWDWNPLIAKVPSPVFVKPKKLIVSQ